MRLLLIALITVFLVGCGKYSKVKEGDRVIYSYSLDNLNSVSGDQGVNEKRWIVEKKRNVFVVRKPNNDPKIPYDYCDFLLVKKHIEWISRHKNQIQIPTFSDSRIRTIELRKLEAKNKFMNKVIEQNTETLREKLRELEAQQIDPEKFIENMKEHRNKDPKDYTDAEREAAEEARRAYGLD